MFRLLIAVFNFGLYINIVPRHINFFDIFLAISPLFFFQAKVIMLLNPNSFKPDNINLESYPADRGKTIYFPLHDLLI